MSAAWTEADLEDLRCLFYGEGKYANVPPYMSASFITHPDSPDPNQLSLYAGCQELARRGLLRSRVLPNGTSVAFFGPRDWEWVHPAAEVRVMPLPDTDIYAALGIPAELLRDDGTRRNRD